MLKQGVRRLLGVVLLLGMPSTAIATPIFSVTVDTTELSVAPGSLSGPFSLFFQFTDGSGTGDSSNTMTLSDFAFGGGSPVAGVTLFGGATGDLENGVSVTDTSFFSSFTQGFTPGSTLSFQLAVTTNVGAIPDLLAFSILDSSGFPIPTEDPSFADALIIVQIDAENPTVFSFGSDLARTGIAITAPDVASVGTVVPEPGTLTLLGAGALVGALRRIRSRRGRTL